MKKYNSNVTFWVISFLALMLTLPFINGFGCDAMIKIESESLGGLYGRCENGKVTFSVKHKVTNEIYEADGYYGYINNRYFVIVTNRHITKKAEANVALPSNYFYRNIYSGFVVRSGQGSGLFLSSSPMPIMWRATLWGKLGFFE